ncbi:uncharacterized protein BCR38DRAFT_326911, partial [Pseudomassariella vexata]
YHAHRQSHNPSKLPAFRFADLQKKSLALPSLLHQKGIPPSPVSPDHDETITQATSTHQRHNHNPVSPEQSTANASPKTSPTRSRASTLQTATALPSSNVKRGIKSPTDSTTTIVAARSQIQRAPASYSSNGIETATGSPSALSTKRQNSVDGSQTSSRPPSDDVTKDWAQGQRELLLPKTVQRADDKKGLVRRPPVSYKPPTTANAGTTTAVPPIRSFRSSGSRRSLVLDMNIRNMRSYDGGDDYTDKTHRDRTLRALEGRQDDDVQQLTPPDSATDQPDIDDSGDVFLRIAQEDRRRAAGENGGYTESSSASRVVRSAHRRPLSAAIPSYQPTSPPQVLRRLSDQPETSRARTYGKDQSAERITRTLTYRGLAREKTTDDSKPKGSGIPSRPSPLTPRSLAFQDGSSEGASAYNRRRQSITDSRMSSLKQSALSPYTHGRTFNSSPLVPKAMESQRNESTQQTDHNGHEGTDSSASTAAPSTVWDELDDMKSRIHRLELTGKLPATSGAAISRATEERPPTATTNATTMSASPKRGSGSAVQQTDVVSTASSQREGHPILQSALNKSKPFLGSDIYSALETAATDALALAAMIGPAGQPGPISSGASNIGSGGNITDRQLRRKADSICRSLTELCLALSETAAQIKQQQEPARASTPDPKSEPDLEASPTITRFSGLAAQRRSSAALIERSPAALTTSPRTLTRLEEKRNSMMFNTLPSPSSRYGANIPPTPERSARKTSLMVSRTRRAVTEEPEDQVGRQTTMLRTRRAGTEEPEEPPSGRKSSLLRTRRAAADFDDEETIRFRGPARAATEAAATKPAGSREYNSHMPLPSIETNSLTSSALPRRRVASSILSTRLVQPSTTSGLPGRRYFDRST